MEYPKCVDRVEDNYEEKQYITYYCHDIEKHVELRNVQPQCKNSRDGDEVAVANIIQDVYKQEVKSNSGDLYG